MKDSEAFKLNNPLLNLLVQAANDKRDRITGWTMIMSSFHEQTVHLRLNWYISHLLFEFLKKKKKKTEAVLTNRPLQYPSWEVMLIRVTPSVL